MSFFPLHLRSMPLSKKFPGEKFAYVPDNAYLCRMSEELGKCPFRMAWVSKPCGGEITENGYCDTHKNVMCAERDCKEHAVETCSSFAGSFVCGRPHCKKHKCKHIY